MYETLLEEVVRDENLAAALALVKRNGGAPGIDHMRTTVSLSIRTCGAVVARWVQPPDAENRTSGGVGGCMGANPMHSTRFTELPHKEQES